MTHAAHVAAISQQVRQQQGNMCAGCQMPHDLPIQRLKADKRVWRLYNGDDVAWTQAQLGYLVLVWLDGDKRNFASENLRALCSGCVRHTDGLKPVRVLQTEMWE